MREGAFVKEVTTYSTVKEIRGTYQLGAALGSKSKSAPQVHSGSLPKIGSGHLHRE